MLCLPARSCTCKCWAFVELWLDWIVVVGGALLWAALGVVLAYYNEVGFVVHYASEQCDFYFIYAFFYFMDGFNKE